MKVTIPYDPAWKALVWAKDNCPSYITNTSEVTGPVGNSKNLVHYYFSDERDVVTFSLKWL
jgi:hypothetical protein